MPVITCPKCGAKNRVDERAAATKQPVCGRCGTKLSVESSGGGDGHPLDVTDATFSRVLADAGDRPVLIDCWATWCPPCRMLAPVIDSLAGEANGRWIIGKLDTDSNPQAASQFGISSIPTMLIFKRGKLVDKLVGVQPKQAIAGRLAKYA